MPQELTNALTTTSPLARHAVEQLTNALHNIAREFHAHDSLRIRIARELAPLLATEPAALTHAGLAALICRQLDEACLQANAIGTLMSHPRELREKVHALRDAVNATMHSTTRPNRHRAHP